jgi:hypothetical protein
MEKKVERGRVVTGASFGLCEYPQDPFPGVLVHVGWQDDVLGPKD